MEWNQGCGLGNKTKLFGLTMDEVMFKGLHLDDNLRIDGV